MHPKVSSEAEATIAKVVMAGLRAADPQSSNLAYKQEQLINGADVAEVVDRRDLKFSALFESPHLFWKTRHDGNRWDKT
jgi:hypothetical protein